MTEVTLTLYYGRGFMDSTLRSAHEVVIDATRSVLQLMPSEVPNDASRSEPSTPNRLLHTVAKPMDATKPRSPRVEKTQHDVYLMAEAFLRAAALADANDDQATASARSRLQDALHEYQDAVSNE